MGKIQNDSARDHPPVTNSPPQTVASFLARFRAGDSTAGNDLLRRYEPWLKLMARLQWESRFQSKFDPADVVQQAMIEAIQSLEKFRGATEAEFTAWLRQILAHALAHEIRRYRGTQKRDIDREVSLDQQLALSSQRLGEVLAAPGTSPSQALARQERELHLATILERLPDDYREVIVLRNLEGLSHEEVARRLGRNSGAVRMLWLRALARLKEEAEKDGTTF